MTDDLECYRCTNCAAIHTEDEMCADYYSIGGGEEEWSNWICPTCGTWHDGLDRGWESVRELLEPDPNGEITSVKD